MTNAPPPEKDDFKEFVAIFWELWWIDGVWKPVTIGGVLLGALLIIDCVT